MKNGILGSGAQGPVAARIAVESAARRSPSYEGEVRALMAAALEVMAGSARPRVADIVARAGLSNDAFYRHFASKDALVTALLEDGTERLAGYLTHVMSKEPSVAGRVRAWVEGVMSQTDPEIAATTLAVLANGGNVGAAAGRHFAAEPLGALLVPLMPPLSASLCAHAVLGRLSDHLWSGTRPSSSEIDAMVAFCRAAAGG